MNFIDDKQRRRTDDGEKKEHKFFFFVIFFHALLRGCFLIKDLRLRHRLAATIPSVLAAYDFHHSCNFFAFISISLCAMSTHQHSNLHSTERDTATWSRNYISIFHRLNTQDDEISASRKKSCSTFSSVKDIKIRSNNPCGLKRAREFSAYFNISSVWKKEEKNFFLFPNKLDEREPTYISLELKHWDNWLTARQILRSKKKCSIWKHTSEETESFHIHFRVQCSRLSLAALTLHNLTHDIHRANNSSSIHKLFFSIKVFRTACARGEMRERIFEFKTR